MDAQAMVFASFAGDALALGGHWIYSALIIEKKYGRLDRYENPLGRSYHPNREKGEFTHYGDQMLLLLGDIAAAGGFVPAHFASSWRKFFDDYDGYFDKATKTTLENFRKDASFRNSGSPSTDLAGAARICPIIYHSHRTGANFLPAVRAQTAMTHNHPDVVKSAVFFGDVALRVLGGQAPTAAIDRAIDSCGGQRQMIEWVRQGKNSAPGETRSTILDFGQDCTVQSAFPGVIHLICKYENNLKEALIENVMAGGDSAARGMMVGMILGAHNGMAAIPEHWLTEMKAYANINRLLKRIDLGAA
jgi:ADP-ribosylglycohydrolase